MKTLRDIVVRNATLFREQPAIVFEGRSISYGAFSDRAFRLANALLALGVRPPERVAILSENRPEYLEVYAAAETAGHILVPMNYRLAAPELAYILEDSAPSVVLFEDQYVATIEGLRAGLPAEMQYVCIGDAPEWAHSYESFIEPHPAEAPPDGPAPGDIAYVIYTSGTTGRPKGAMLSHAGQVALAEDIALELAARPDDRKLVVMPFYHIGAKCNQLAYSFRGATLILHRRYDVQAIIESLGMDGATAAHLAPIMVQDLIDAWERAPFPHTLNLIQYASGPMAVAHIERGLAAFGPIFVQVYGMTETGGGTALHRHQHFASGRSSDVERLASAGQAFSRYGVRVVRPDGSACDTDETGEILLRSPSLMLGYWNRHAATLAAIRDGWMHTGDIGRMDGDGFVYVLDRKNDMIVSGGENIYPREVEEALYTHPAVAEAAVVGMADARWGEAVKAFVSLRPGASATEAELIGHCRAQIASYKKPKAVVFLDALPRLANKKIDKKALRTMA